MVINFRLELIVAFLSLSLLTGQELAAQDRHDISSQDISGKFENIGALKMSSDGSWLTLLKKSYDPEPYGNRCKIDSMLIFDLRDTMKVRTVTTRPEVRKLYFVGNTHLLLSYVHETELLNLEENIGTRFPGATESRILKNQGQFLLYYGEREKKRLELRDCNGLLLNAVNNVRKYYFTDSGSIYVITENDKGRSEVSSLKDGKLHKIYKSDPRIVTLEVDPGEHGIIVYQQYPDNENMEVLYLDLTTKACFPLKEVLSEPFQNGFSEVIREGELYFLRLWVKSKNEGTSPVDIWYGTDNKLEEKFYQSIKEVYYKWEPLRKRIQRIGSDSMHENGNIGDERFFLSFDPSEMQDYTEPPPHKINIFDSRESTYTPVDTLNGELYASPDGQYLLYPKDESWYTYNILTGEKQAFGNSKLQSPYFTPDGKKILFTGEECLWLFDCNETKLSRLGIFPGGKVNILNTSAEISNSAENYTRETFDPEKPLVLELYNDRESMRTYLLWKNGEYDTIIPSTKRYIKNLKYDDKYIHFSYMEEDYNLPPRLVYKTIGKKGKLIYQSNRKDQSVLSLRQEIVSYTNSEGSSLKGVLYYPLHYNSFQKYPMIVYIYQRQYHLANRYPFPSYYDDQGFNIRLLLEKGYFVYLPDITFQGHAGPGKDALDCVNRSLNVLSLNPLIDMDKTGLIGHSLGGYETDFIATHSGRFAAYVSGSGKVDIIWAYHSFNYLFLAPDYWRFEKINYNMGASFTEDKLLYFDNNPVYNADKVNAPVLLWTGLDDKNVTSDQSMAFYNALRRNRKDVIALFYEGEGHTLENPQAKVDLTSRILDWFDYCLKSDTAIQWISEGIRK